MKKRGFTLIELLAVIVVLAVVALIAFPIIAGIIEKTKRSAAYRSVEGYVEAANNAAVLYDLDNNKGINVTEAKHTFTSNVDTDAFSKIKAKGTLPTYSYLDFDINKKVVTEGHFCINGYSVLYSEGTAKASETKYCEEDNTGGNGSGSNSGGNNQNGGSYAGNVRWNPETKYYEVLYDGTWYQDRYFDPVWDGYIYNNGAFDTEYYLDEYNNYLINTSSSGGSVTYPANRTTKITSTVAPFVNQYGNFYPITLYSMNKKAFHIDKPCTITFEIETSGSDMIQSYATSSYAQTAQLYIKSNSSADTSGVLLNSGNLSYSSTSYTFDLRDSQYLDTDIYWGYRFGAYSKNGSGTTTTGTFNIKSIHVEYYD